MKLKTNDEYVVFLENKLNTDIGYFYWKKYIASAFWSQISMPINLIITLMTAITTAGQANSPNLLPKEVSVKISIVTLLITVLNTFFRPHEQMTNNIDIMLKWRIIGIEFEKIYYSEFYTDNDIVVRINKYHDLETKINILRQSEGPDTINFITDFMHIVMMNLYLRKYQNWLDVNKVIVLNDSNNAGSSNNALVSDSVVITVND